MKTSEVIRQLLNTMGPLDPKDEAIRIGIIAILDRSAKATEQKPEAVPEQKPKKRGRRPFDIGKAKACKDAGWSIAKIADEMGVSEQTVRNNLAKAS